MFGIEEFTAVINPPEAGILAVGAVEERPVVVDGEVVVRPA
jgi:pyruvate dehydrogenase E2 component (dihydrolipoamide acetyltransferase)